LDDLLFVIKKLLDAVFCSFMPNSGDKIAIMKVFPVPLNPVSLDKTALNNPCHNVDLLVTTIRVKIASRYLDFPINRFCSGA